MTIHWDCEIQGGGSLPFEGLTEPFLRSGLGNDESAALECAAKRSE